MSVRIWLEAVHHQGFRTVGWAFVREDAGQVSGTAGGERGLDAERATLSALGAVMTALPPAGKVEVLTTSTALLAIRARIAAAERGEKPPTENLDLWAQATTGLRRPNLVLSRATNVAGGPTAFAAAWAEQAFQRTKDKGAFTAAIPKPNLAKAGVPQP